MTRETKIGLLIGLGFIVVFAVLLSHTSGPVPIVEPRPIAMGTTPEGLRPVGAPAESSRLPVGLSGHTPPAASWPSPSESNQADGPRAIPASPEERPFDPLHENRRDVLADASRPESGASTSNPLRGLPRPVVLDGARRLTEGVLSPSSAQADASVATADVPQGRAELASATRVAPPRIVLPSERGQDARTDSSGAVVDAGEAQREAPADTAAEEYVVQRGDTVVKIVKANYGSASPRNIDYFVASNSDRIRDRNTIIEGQRLVIPQLPPELFEPAPGFDVRGTSSDAQQASSEQLAEAVRQVPSIPTAGRAEPQIRLYEIKPNDTLGNIAQRELGSTAYWKEIQKLNPDIDPRRMQPGTQIRLPAEPPVSENSGNNRQERA